MTFDSFLTADGKFMSNQIILELGSAKTNKDDPRRIQTGETEFILPPRIIYHSCDPNAFINWSDMTLRALKQIEKNKTITYHYGTSEYDYSVGAFDCDCGSNNCVRHFSGYVNMTTEQRAGISDYISKFIRNKGSL